MILLGLRVGYVTLDEYRAMPGDRTGLHETCEAARHDGQEIPTVAVIALRINGTMLVWGLCAGCFKELDDDIGEDSMFSLWHLRSGHE